MGKILVTGITGNVGRYVHQALLEMGEEVVGGVTKISKAQGKISDAELVEFDFLREDTFGKALEGVDRAFLMRPPHLGKPEDIYPFIDYMKQQGIRMVVFLSLMGIEKNPVPPHYKIEKYIEKAGLPYCHIRPGFFMQNLTGTHAEEIRKGNEIFIPAGRSKCSFIDTRDIGIAIATVLHQCDSHRGKAYTITGGEALDYYQAADILTEVLGRRIVYSSPSWLRFRQHMIHKRALDKKAVNVMVMLYFITRLGISEAVTNDFEKLTGKKPRSFYDFVIENKNAWI